MARARQRVGATALGVALLLALSAPYASAQTGAISGTVLRDGGGGIQSVTVNAYLNGTGFPYGATTSAAGTYTVSNLPPGTYYLVTLSFLDVVDELYPNTPCPDTLCLLTAGTPVIVSSGATTANINFTLAQGPVITGRLTNAANGAYLQGITVRAYDIHGNNMGSMPSNVYGVYQLHAVPAGTYYVRTFASGYLNELYDNIPCSPSCTVTSGTPIIAVAGQSIMADFALVSTAGTISGAVTDAGTAAGLNEVTVAVYNTSGSRVATADTSGGAYAVSGLTPGTYFAITEPRGTSHQYFAELYDNITCNPYVHTCTITSGTPIVVTSGGTTTVNFALAKGGRINGVVTSHTSGLPLASVWVTVYNSSMTAGQSYITPADGSYSSIAMPAGNYYAIAWTTNQPYVDELYDDLPCAMNCVPNAGTPIGVTAGVTTPGIDFTLAPGGRFTGTVTNARTNGVVSNVPVLVFDAAGHQFGAAWPNGSGVYLSKGLPTGTYYARTMASGSYADELFHDLPCLADCTPSAGTPIAVSAGTLTSLIDFSLEPNLVRNGQFSSGTTNWSLWATPNMGYMWWAVATGVFEYYRVAPPPGTSNQAVIFQNTGTSVPAASPVAAQFDLGNSSSARKRISVLLLDSDFSDLSVCTFWLPPNSPLQSYRMVTHTTKAWTNASVYFYAASAGSDGGAYRLDNVLVYRDPNESATQTRCVYPTRPTPPGGADGPTLLTNGNFEAGSLAPWTTYGTITTQLSAGVLEFLRPTSAPPAGVVLQTTSEAMSAQQALTASFSLGNPSDARKRVTVLLHDLDFTDLSACTFWLAPSQPLATYSMRTFATQPWVNATISVYPATTSATGWMQLDDVTLQRTPGATLSGTDCVEPGAFMRGATRTATGVTAAQGGLAPLAAGMARPSTPPRGGLHNAEGAWTHEASETLLMMESLQGIDLRTATHATLHFTSDLVEPAAGEVQVRVDGGAWFPIYVARATGEAVEVEIDLVGLTGGVLDIRFVEHPAGAAVDPGDHETLWRISDVVVDVR